MIGWVLVLLFALAPDTPWADTYGETAAAIAYVAETEPPLFDGEHGREKTAALLVAIGYRESTFKPGALGDKQASLGLFQIWRGHLTPGTADAFLVDPEQQARASLELVRTSFAVCHARPLEERLGWYAHGQTGCDHALKTSRDRMRIAKTLYREHPPP